jgi:signal transduction histidine kinase
VLVVEDDDDMRAYLRRLLSPHYTVSTASRGLDALELAVGHPPTIVISDLRLPDLDGLDLLKALRHDVRTRDTPVILVSSRADEESILAALELGADDYVVKPFGSRELVARVRAAGEHASLRSRTAEDRGRTQERISRRGELQALLDDLKATQRRVVAAADEERQRIERDLHDGAQQGLTAIRLELSLLGERLEEDPARARSDLERLRGDLDAALDELRELAHGLYPPLLASDGLHAALATACRRAPVPVAFDGSDVGRLPAAIESAAYFCCVEALQNVAKHAGAGARATVQLERRKRAVAFHVRDDGAGFDPRTAAGGQGLTNLRDRLAALGGHAGIESAVGRGTIVSGRIPLP